MPLQTRLAAQWCFQFCSAGSCCCDQHAAGCHLHVSNTPGAAGNNSACSTYCHDAWLLPLGLGDRLCHPGGRHAVRGGLRALRLPLAAAALQVPRTPCFLPQILRDASRLLLSQVRRQNTACAALAPPSEDTYRCSAAYEDCSVCPHALITPCWTATIAGQPTLSAAQVQEA